MSNNIDKLFKKKLEQETFEPPHYIWERIERQLDARKKKKKIFLWALSGAAVVAFLFSLSGLLELKNDPEQQNQVISSLRSEKLPDDTLKENSNPSLRAKQFINEIKRQNSILATNTASKRSEECNEKQEFFLPVNTRKNIEIAQVAGSTPDYKANIQSLRRDYIPLTSKAALENNKQYLNLIKESTTLQAVKEEKKDRINLSLSGHIAPIYSSGKYNAPPANSARNYSNASSQVNGTVNVSGGLKLSLATGKRLSVQTGLFYTQTGQRTKGNNVYIPRSSTTLLASGTNSYVATPLGNIKSKSQAMVYYAEGAAAMRANSESGNIEQVFGSLEIPLNVKYQLNDNKVKFTVMGGFSGSFIVNNQAFLEYGNRKELMGKTEDIRNFNISTDFGLGMEYPLSPKIKIMLEPGFRYFLQSLSQDNEINYKPYIFSLSTGIGINF